MGLFDFLKKDKKGYKLSVKKDEERSDLVSSPQAARHTIHRATASEVTRSSMPKCRSSLPYRQASCGANGATGIGSTGETAMAKKKPTAELVKGVIYARYSSSGQRDESIEGQLRDCHAFAKKYGIVIVGEYCDRALTGTSDKRPEFQRMIRDSGKGQFSVVITWKNDRFARSRYDSAIYKYKLKQNGIRVLYAKESIPDGPEGIILESVMEGFAEYYSANLSQNVKRGNYDSALQRQTLGQTVLGLRKGPDKRFEIDPATAPVVRRIFEEYAAGRPAVDIFTDLNAEGFRTSRGNLFNKNSLRRILQNEKYVGVYEFADIRDEEGIPPIVDRELFDKVQKMVERHHRQPAAKKVNGGSCSPQSCSAVSVALL